MLREGGIIEESVKYIFASVVGGIVDQQEAISTVAKQMKKLIGVEPTTEEAASGFGKSKWGGTVDGKASTRTSPDKASGAHTLKNGKIIMSMSERNCL